MVGCFDTKWLLVYAVSAALWQIHAAGKLFLHIPHLLVDVILTTATGFVIALCTLFAVPTPPAVHVAGTIVACFLIGRVMTFSRSGLAFYATDSVAGKAVCAVSSAMRAGQTWFVAGTREKAAILFAHADSHLYTLWHWLTEVVREVDEKGLSVALEGATAVRKLNEYQTKLGVSGVSTVEEWEEDSCSGESNYSTSSTPNESCSTLDVDNSATTFDKAPPPPETWPHRPVFCRLNSSVSGQRALSGWATILSPHCAAGKEKQDTGALSASANMISSTPPGHRQNHRLPTPTNNNDVCCPINTESALEFETELFAGRILLRFRGVGCNGLCTTSTSSASGASTSAMTMTTQTPPSTPDSYFQRRRMTWQVVVQGSFKEEVAMSDVRTGNEFDQPFQCLPPPVLLHLGTRIFMAVTPGLEADLTSDRPHFTTLLGGGLTVLSAKSPAEAPDITSEIEEDTRRLGGEFARGDTRLSAARRQRILSDPAKAMEYRYNTRDVYTFDYQSDLILMDTCEVDIGIARVGFDQFMGGRPLQVMAKHADGRNIYNFELWHEKLLLRSDI